MGRQRYGNPSKTVSHPNDPELGSISDVWTYDEANGGQTRYGLLTSERRTQGMLQFNGDEPVPFQADTWQKFYAHDAALRPSGYSTTIHPHSYGNQGNAPIINASTYTVSMAYDSYFGRIKSITYPQSGVGEYTRYDINGFVIEQGHSNDYADPGKFWHQVLEMTASGQISRERYGNGVVQDYDHDARTQQMTETQISLGGPNLNQIHSYQHDLFGNLIQQTRSASIGTSTEDFTYDHQHRLRNSTRSGAANGGSISYSYDELGNLLSKSDYGDDYQYGIGLEPANCNSQPVLIPGPHAVSRVTASNNGGTYEYGYDANGNLICSSNSHNSPNSPMQIHYDPTNKPFRVQRGARQTEFWYGSDDQRYFQRDNNAGDTIYVGKLFEQKGNVKKYYLGNYAVFTADLSNGDKINYLHKDRLGSIIAISDEMGNNVNGTGRGFDPFGKPREDDWEDSNGFDDATGLDGDINGYETTSRGFTGHEHLNGTDLIHMTKPARSRFEQQHVLLARRVSAKDGANNGRAYDYNLGRFLSVDPVIQFPANSQSLNPYSYIMNNPMAGTDPTGYTGSCPKSDPKCNSRENEDEENAKPGTTTDQCKRGAACDVTDFGDGNGNGDRDEPTTNKGDEPERLNRSDLRSQGDAIDTKNQNNPEDSNPLNFRQNGEPGSKDDSRFPRDTITLPVDNDHRDVVTRIIPSLNLFVWEDNDGNMVVADINDFSNKVLVNGVVTVAFSALGAISVKGNVSIVSSGKSAPKPSPNFKTPTNQPQNPPTLLPEGHSVRLMPPTQQYPNGYWRQYNQGGQPVNPSTGKPPSNVSRAESRAQTHVPLPAKDGGQ